MAYYLNRGGQQSGPFSLPDLEQMASEGRLSASDLVWRSDLEAWKPAGEVVGYFRSRPPVTPPPPVALGVPPATASAPRASTPSTDPPSFTFGGYTAGGQSGP
ncbi:MAG: DUF4339 domain-containing protein [Acidobacteria bacterium]|nr:MAG: DUF4339 domain-containing protein [Acidobacteriota bacterium]